MWSSGEYFQNSYGELRDRINGFESRLIPLEVEKLRLNCFWEVRCGLGH